MLVIIPARGGSKGVPRKNVKALAGRPLIAYAIGAALAARRVDRVIVSTEDAEIAQVARDHGAEVPFMRPAELATDTAPNGAACLDAIDRLAALEGTARDAFALVQPTSPLIEAEDIDNAIALFEDKDAAAVVSLTPCEVPIESVCEIGDDGHVISVLRERYGADFTPDTRQTYGARYTISGAVTVVRVARMRDDVNYYYGNPESLAYAIPEPRGFDIDTPLDFALAELLVGQRSKELVGG